MAKLWPCVAKTFCPMPICKDVSDGVRRIFLCGSKFPCNSSRLICYGKMARTCSTLHFQIGELSLRRQSGVAFVPRKLPKQVRKKRSNLHFLLLARGTM